MKEKLLSLSQLEVVQEGYQENLKYLNGKTLFLM